MATSVIPLALCFLYIAFYFSSESLPPFKGLPLTTFIYIHGFLSSPQSKKAQQTKAWLEKKYPTVRYECPALSSYPAQAQAALDTLIQEINSDDIAVIGSSLGGYWATYLVETQAVKKAVLVNPAALPHARFKEYVGRELQSYYTEEKFVLSEKDLDDLVAVNFDQLLAPEKYWLMAQKGDQTLDYRLAEKKYAGAKKLIEDGGSHTFDGFEQWLPEIYDFLVGE